LSANNINVGRRDAKRRTKRGRPANIQNSPQIMSIAHSPYFYKKRKNTLREDYREDRTTSWKGWCCNHRVIKLLKSHGRRNTDISATHYLWYGKN